MFRDTADTRALLATLPKRAFRELPGRGGRRTARFRYSEDYYPTVDEIDRITALAWPIHGAIVPDTRVDSGTPDPPGDRYGIRTNRGRRRA